jgi:hypothetical protein
MSRALTSKPDWWASRGTLQAAPLKHLGALLVCLHMDDNSLSSTQPHTSAGIRQLDLFDQFAPRVARFQIAIVPEIESALQGRSPVFIAVSGGKDSQALAYRTAEFLDKADYVGPRFLIHSDLGRVEWK